VPRERFGTPRALETGEVRELVEAFGQAARRSREAGFDAVQIHGAHGYLASQFLSPFFNRREDEYGGSLEGRMRFCTEVYRAVRAEAGDLPVHIKLNLTDFFEGSTTPEDALPLAQRLSELGIDAIEVSAGGPFSGGRGPARTGVKRPEDEGYLMDLARLTRERTACAVIGMGGFRSPQVIEAALASGDVDFVALSRPLIREPDLVERWRRGDRSPSLCQSCSGCFKTLERGEGIQCLVELEERTRSGAG
jgi:2,4-dienoyl-CoA reductase-like NADH-dependent reductase (Old Yellow Enzyme family)